MEHAQRASGKYTLYKQGESVLILILMEHAQRDKIRTINVNQLKGLNPYFNGTCSKRYYSRTRALTLQES